MKLGLIAAACALSIAHAQTVDDFFNDNVLHEIRLTLPAADWQKLKDNFELNTYYQADFQWRSQTVTKIGIRSRGRGSRSPIKPGLFLNFDKFVDKQEFLGLGGLILKPNVQDPSLLHERLSMLLFRRMGLPASREAHTRLFVNNDYAGLYMIVEDIDSDFLMRHFGESSGYLYEFRPVGSGYHFEYRGSDPALYSPEPFDPQNHDKNPDPKPLEAMVRAINQSSDAEFQGAISQFLDIKLFLTHVAIETYLAEFDGILGDVFGMNNFFLYRFQGKNLSQMIVWDKDNAFDYEARDIFQNADQNVLMRRALAVPELRTAYLEALIKTAIVAGGPGGWLEQESNREYNQIRDAAREDSRKLLLNAGMLVPSSNDDFEAAVVHVIEFARQRADFVLRAVSAAGYQPSAGAPRLADGGAVNAADNSATVLAPGSLASVYGERLSSSSAGAARFPLPTSLNGVSFWINGFAAPLAFVSTGQANLQVPWEIAPASVPLAAIVNGVPSNILTTSIALVSPGVFAVAHADGSVVSADRPAVAAETLVVYATGLGPVSTTVVTGQPASGSTRESARVSIGGANADVSFSGLSPGFVGLYQVNVRMPAVVPASARTPLVVSVGGQNSSAFAMPTR